MSDIWDEEPRSRSQYRQTNRRQFEPRDRLWKWLAGAMGLLMLILIGVLAWMLLNSGITTINPVMPGGIDGHKVFVDTAKAGDLYNQTLGDLYIEGANQIRSGKLKNFTEFMDWKEEQQKKGGPADQRDFDIHTRYVKPHLDAIKQPTTDASDVATVLESIGRGYRD